MLALVGMTRLILGSRVQPAAHPLTHRRARRPRPVRPRPAHRRLPAMPATAAAPVPRVARRHRARRRLDFRAGRTDRPGGRVVRAGRRPAAPGRTTRGAEHAAGKPPSSRDDGQRQRREPERIRLRSQPFRREIRFGPDTPPAEPSSSTARLVGVDPGRRTPVWPATMAMVAASSRSPPSSQRDQLRPRPAVSARAANPPGSGVTPDTATARGSPAISARTALQRNRPAPHGAPQRTTANECRSGRARDCRVRSRCAGGRVGRQRVSTATSAPAVTGWAGGGRSPRAAPECPEPGAASVNSATLARASSRSAGATASLQIRMSVSVLRTRSSAGGRGPGRAGLGASKPAMWSRSSSCASSGTPTEDLHRIAGHRPARSAITRLGVIERPPPPTDTDRWTPDDRHARPS